MDKNAMAVLIGHPDPDPDRFVRKLAQAYADGARAAGGQVQLFDLARMEFPIMRGREDFESEAPADGVVSQFQAAIRDSGHLAIFHPLWLGGMPALLKALLEQTCRGGFAFDPGRTPFARKLGPADHWDLKRGLSTNRPVSGAEAQEGWRPFKLPRRQNGRFAPNPLRGAADFDPECVGPGLWRTTPPHPPLLFRTKIRHAPRPKPNGPQALKGHSARIVVTMGMPAWLYRYWYGMPGIRMLERNILGFIGFAPIRRSLIGSVDALGETGRARWLSRMTDLGRRDIS